MRHDSAVRGLVATKEANDVEEARGRASQREQRAFGAVVEPGDLVMVAFLWFVEDRAKDVCDAGWWLQPGRCEGL